MSHGIYRPDLTCPSSQVPRIARWLRSSRVSPSQADHWGVGRNPSALRRLLAGGRPLSILGSGSADQADPKCSFVRPTSAGPSDLTGESLAALPLITGSGSIISAASRPMTRVASG